MTIAILAAGTARRMGKQKLVLPIDGRPMIAAVIAAASAWPLIVVAGNDVAAVLGPAPPRIVPNGAPERGMSYSLALADAAISASEPIAVLLGDVPDITAEHIAAVIAAYDDGIDVVVPQCGGAFTHPVIFGPLARRKIAVLPDGDTIKRLRDDPRLRRRIVETGCAPVSDIDTPDDYIKRAGRHAGGSGFR